MGNDRRPAGGGFAAHLSSILQLLAGGLAATLVPLVKNAWPIIFHRPLIPGIEASLPYWLAASAMAVTAWILARPFSRRLAKTLLPTGAKVSIYVARFGDDSASDAARVSVMKTLHQELGKGVEIRPAEVQLRFSDQLNVDEWTTAPDSEAKAVLEKLRGDLLIWGRLHEIAGKTEIELRFVSSHNSGDLGRPYTFANTITLEPRFGVEMGTALALRVAAYLPGDGYSYWDIDNDSISRANRLGLIVRQFPLSMEPQDRRKILFSYASLQCAIAERDGGIDRFKEAIAVLRTLVQVLEDASPSSLPDVLEWAKAKNNLGLALHRLGDTEGRIVYLKESISTLEEVIKKLGDWNGDLVLRQCITVQSNLSIALTGLGRVEGDIKHLRRAVGIHRDTLEKLKKRKPEEFTRYKKEQVNLCYALQLLNERGDGIECLDEAVILQRDAQTGLTVDDYPNEWGFVHNGLGCALGALGENNKNIQQLKQARDSFHAALQGWTRTSRPRQWADVQTNLANTLHLMGRVENGPGRVATARSVLRLGMAIEASREALEERVCEREPLAWARTSRNLADSLITMGTKTGKSRYVDEAISIARDILQKGPPRDLAPLDWIAAKEILGLGLATLGVMTQRKDRLVEAVNLYREVIAGLGSEESLCEWARLKFKSGNALVALSQATDSLASLEEGIASYREALSVSTIWKYFNSTVAARLDEATRLLATKLAGTASEH